MPGGHDPSAGGEGGKTRGDGGWGLGVTWQPITRCVGGGNGGSYGWGGGVLR